MRIPPETLAKIMAAPGVVVRDARAAGRPAGETVAVPDPPKLPRLREPSLKLDLVVPYRAVSEPNTGGRLRAKIRRKADAKAAWAATVSYYGLADWPPAWPRQRWMVRLTRLGGRPLDGHDNLPASLKYLVDAVAAWLGVDDGDTARVLWGYGQEPGGLCGVRVEVGLLGAIGGPT